MTPKKRCIRFVKAFTRILRDYRLSPADKCVLWCIKSYCDADGYCVPSVDRIGADLKLSRTTIHKSMKKLKSMGLMNWTHRVERGNQTSSQYVFTDEHFAKHCAESRCIKKRTPTVVQKVNTSKMKKEQIPANVVPIQQAG
jgi:hypothetical protein